MKRPFLLTVGLIVSFAIVTQAGVLRIPNTMNFNPTANDVVAHAFLNKDYWKTNMNIEEYKLALTYVANSDDARGSKYWNTKYASMSEIHEIYRQHIAEVFGIPVVNLTTKSMLKLIASTTFKPVPEDFGKNYQVAGFKDDKSLYWYPRPGRADEMIGYYIDSDGTITAWTDANCGNPTKYTPPVDTPTPPANQPSSTPQAQTSQTAAPVIVNNYIYGQPAQTAAVPGEYVAQPQYVQQQQQYYPPQQSLGGIFGAEVVASIGLGGGGGYAQRQNYSSGRQMFGDNYRSSGQHSTKIINNYGNTTINSNNGNNYGGGGTRNRGGGGGNNGGGTSNGSPVQGASPGITTPANPSVPGTGGAGGRGNIQSSYNTSSLAQSVNATSSLSSQRTSGINTGGSRSGGTRSFGGGGRRR